MEILVFKTNIHNQQQAEKLIPHLKNLAGITKCNVDLHDRDKILRIEAETVSPRIIEQHLHQAGYFCEELQD